MRISTLNVAADRRNLADLKNAFKWVASEHDIELSGSNPAGKYKSIARNLGISYDESVNLVRSYRGMSIWEEEEQMNNDFRRASLKIAGQDIQLRPGESVYDELSRHVQSSGPRPFAAPIAAVTTGLTTPFTGSFPGVIKNLIPTPSSPSGSSGSGFLGGLGNLFSGDTMSLLLMMMMMGGGSGQMGKMFKLMLMLQLMGGTQTPMGNIDPQQVMAWTLLPKMGTLGTMMLGGISGLIGASMKPKTRRRRYYPRRRYYRRSK